MMNSPILYQKYPFALPPLPYAYEALEPHISCETLHYHHDKHFAAYVDNLNKALEPFPDLQNRTLFELLSHSAALPVDARVAILHNGGGAYNHDLYFNGLSPQNHFSMDIPLQQAVVAQFGSIDRLKKAISDAANSVFGSGWACLGRSRSGQLVIITMANQDTIIPLGLEPILLCDVWEHAYYLDYKNERPTAVENWWQLVAVK